MLFFHDTPVKQPSILIRGIQTKTKQRVPMYFHLPDIRGSSNFFIKPIYATHVLFEATLTILLPCNLVTARFNIVTVASICHALSPLKVSRFGTVEKKSADRFDHNVHSIRVDPKGKTCIGTCCPVLVWMPRVKMLGCFTRVLLIKNNTYCQFH